MSNKEKLEHKFKGMLQQAANKDHFLQYVYEFCEECFEAGGATESGTFKYEKFEDFIEQI